MATIIQNDHRDQSQMSRNWWKIRVNHLYQNRLSFRRHHHQEQIGHVVTSWVTPYSASLFLHAFRSPQMSISCWMLSLFSVMSIPRLLMSCCILDIQVVLGRPRFLFDGFSASVSAFLPWTSGSSRIRWPIQEWRRLSIVLLHGSAFVSLYRKHFLEVFGHNFCLLFLLNRNMILKIQYGCHIWQNGHHCLNRH